MSQEEKDELDRNLGHGYYKMSQTKIIALVGCTVSICLTVFGAVLYIDRSITRNSIEIEQNKIDIQNAKVDNARLWGKCSELDNKLNHLYENGSFNNSKFNQ